MTGKCFKTLLPVFILFLISLGLAWHNFQTEQGNNHDNGKLLQELNEIRAERDSIAKQRDSLVRYSDDLNRRHREAVVTILELKKKIKMVPGRYKDAPRDSLGILMDQRADSMRIKNATTN